MQHGRQEIAALQKKRARLEKGNMERDKLLSKQRARQMKVNVIVGKAGERTQHKFVEGLGFKVKKNPKLRSGGKNEKTRFDLDILHEKDTIAVVEIKSGRAKERPMQKRVQEAFAAKEGIPRVLLPEGGKIKVTFGRLGDD